MIKKDSPFLYLLVLLMVIFLCCLTHIAPGHNWGGDFALYLHQAKSIIEGNIDSFAISNQFIVDNSSEHDFSPYLAPWGFPLILAPVYTLFGLNFGLLKVLESLFLIGALILIYFIFKKSLNTKYSLLSLAIIGFNINYIRSINSVVAGLPFLFFSFLGLYLILLILEEKHRNSILWALLTGSVLFFSFMIRTEGIGLFMALFAGQIALWIKCKKKGKQIVTFALPYLTALALYALKSQFLPTGFTSHLDHKNLISWQGFYGNLMNYKDWLAIDYFGFPHLPFPLYGIIVSGILFLILTGIIIRFKKDITIIIYFLFLVCLFAIWPFAEKRHLYSIFPLALYFFVQGLNYIIENYLKTPSMNWIGIGTLSLLLILNLIPTSLTTYSLLKRGHSNISGPETTESQEMFSFIKQETPQKAIIGFYKPRVMHFYTGRLALRLNSGIPEIIQKADYFVELKNSSFYNQNPLATDSGSLPEHLEEVFSNQDFNIYKVKKPQTAPLPQETLP